MTALVPKPAELIGQDLAGYQLTQVFYLEPDHRLVGSFPVVITETKQRVVCGEQRLLKRVEKYLVPTQRVRVVSMWALFRAEDGCAFEMRIREGQLDLRPFRLLTEEQLEKIIARGTAKPFSWDQYLT
ncbi:MAG: hypothetical protein WEA04_03930 [Candidatus Andersenbacteria bacterium]